MEQVDGALRAQPGDRRGKLERARVLLAAGERAGQTELEALARDHPGWSAPRVVMATHLAEGGLQASALEWVETALRLEPWNADGLVLRGRLRLADSAAALADAEEAVRQAPWSVEARVLRVMALGARQELDRAGEEADALVLAAPGDSRAWLARAVVRSHGGDHAGAEADATRSLRLDPERERRMARQVRALARLAAGRPAEALDDAEALVLVRRGEVDAWRLRAQAQEQLGRPDLALRDLERISVIAGDDRSPGAAALRAHIERLRAVVGR